VSKKDEFIKHLEIALDMLDRIEGTTIYQIQKRAMGWTDKEYARMLEDLALFLLQVRQRGKNNE